MNLPASGNIDIVAAYRATARGPDTSRARTSDDWRWLEALGKERIVVADKLQKDLRKEK